MVLCTFGSIFQSHFYKYFAALLLFDKPIQLKHPDCLNLDEYSGNLKVRNTVIFVE
jgi:hypothetical protein